MTLTSGTEGGAEGEEERGEDSRGALTLSI